MKKCLQLSVLPLLLSAVLFCSCKDDNPGNPNPIVDASVQDAKVTIDQANKRIDVLFYEYNPLSYPLALADSTACDTAEYAV